MKTFVSKVQSKGLMIFDWYLPNFESLIVFYCFGQPITHAVSIREWQQATNIDIEKIEK